MAVILTFWGTWSKLFSQWSRSDDYAYGMMIPPICLLLVWERRKALAALALRADLRGLLLMLFAVILFGLGELGAELFTTRAAVITLFIGALWWMHGRAVVRTLALPLLLLYFMLPLPGFVYRSITFPLQIMASTISVHLLNALGFLAYREGNIIDMGFGQFQIVEACNGLRFILPLLCMGVVIAFFRPMAGWKRTVLIGITIPLALATNIVRIVGTGILARYLGTEVAEGFFHDFSGWAVFTAAFALFMVIAAVLNRLPGRAQPPAPRPPSRRPARPIKTVNWKRAVATTAIALAVCLVSPLTVNVLGDVPPVALKQTLDDFPLTLDGRDGQRAQMAPEIWERVGGQAYTMIAYQKKGHPPIDFYTAYYAHQKKGGDFIHSPRLCLPGAGWSIRSNRVRTLRGAPGTGDQMLKINEMLVEKNGAWQLAYFWYQGRDRNFTSEWAAKFYMVWDGIFRRRTDGALVRLIMPLNAQDQVPAARRELDRFALLTARTLDTYLP
ncbi:VPLPA-CTERM-specific exosortase XrtD [Desulfosarcina variabilis]|uniref:VPLPA-CTERM-specific exosortase XrtD n=1 Tax=Desulfosarcina variabilis TaxID=2300 RepID=UPI003AFA70B1